MKLEHRAIIERANRDGLLPSEIASELLEHDLTTVCLDQLRGQSAPFGSLSENAQQETIERIVLGVKDAVRVAIRTIAANGVVTVPIDIKRVQVDAKNLTVTATVDGKDPKKHDLVDSAGHLCLLVMAPDDYSEGLDGIRAERDQHELPLSAAERIAGMGLDLGLDRQTNFDNLEKQHLEESKGLLKEAQANHEAQYGKEFGDFDYDDAKQLIVLKANGKPFKAHWVQSRLAVSSDQATTLLLRLLDDQVIAVETEGESALEHSYKVTATLEDVVV
ncbi:hypothetical protein D3C77_41950 [compost metagenome]